MTDPGDRTILNNYNTVEELRQNIQSEKKQLDQLENAINNGGSFDFSTAETEAQKPGGSNTAGGHDTDYGLPEPSGKMAPLYKVSPVDKPTQAEIAEKYKDSMFRMDTKRYGTDASDSKSLGTVFKAKTKDGQEFIITAGHVPEVQGQKDQYLSSTLSSAAEINAGKTGKVALDLDSQEFQRYSDPDQYKSKNYSKNLHATQGTDLFTIPVDGNNSIQDPGGSLQKA